MKGQVTLVLFCVTVTPIIAVVIGSGRAVATPSASTLDNLIHEFIASPSAATWQQAELVLRSDPDNGQVDRLALVIKYHLVRERRDFPNSMALVGITPNEFVQRQQTELDSLIRQIRSQQSTEVWNLLNTMSVQTFDDQLVWTASEIAWRLSPQRFKKLNDDVASAAPSNSHVFKESLERLRANRKNVEQTQQ